MRKVFTFDLTHFYNMVKRKQSTSSELRTAPVSISLQRYKDLPALQLTAKSYWDILHLQPFFPPIECLFKTENLNFSHEYGIKLNNQISLVLPTKDEINVLGSLERHKIHIKKTMILSPFKWMQGDYGTSLGLPTTSEQAASIQSKLQNANNASYIGSLISVVLSESGCQHFPKVYGVFSGVSQNHTIDISDDYEELSDRPWFSQNIGKTFELKLNDFGKDDFFPHTRSARASVQLGDDITLGDVEELETEHIESSMADLKMIQNEMETDSSSLMSDSSSVSTSYIFNIESCDCDDDDRDIMEEMESDNSFAWATFSNVPVQLTVMEQCTGTLYELMTRETDTSKHLDWLTQVMFALAYAQRNFGFVHNDLHSNNVMFISTDKQFFYYNLCGVLYKVPTHGYLIKIIDFERGVTSIRVNGMKESKFFMSDHFSINEEAGGQYNYPPFYIGKYAEVKPNPSFDLVRLATSLFWDFFPEGPRHEEYKKNPVFILFMKWLTLEDGTSVLFGKEDPRHDRYHGFGLYKAIARYCKDTAIPRKELASLKMFYETQSVPMGEIALVIDA